jgi:acetyl esterase/lipase
MKAVVIMVLMIGATTPDPIIAQDADRQKSARPPTVVPTHVDVKYGPHDRNLMDVSLANDDQPTPVLISIHGGAFRHGDKSVSKSVLRECLPAGISVAAITYRFSDKAIAPAQHLDAARAVQFIRHKVSEWNLDPSRMASTGGSAGAGMSLWLGFHDDLADPQNDDPVLRQSTRLTCMAVNNGQSSYDPRFIRDLFPGTDTWTNSALAQLFDVDLSKLDDLAEDKYRLFEEVSAINHLTKDDVPVLMTYDSDMDTPISSRSIGIHHPRFGNALKDRMDELGIECQVHTGFTRTGASRSKLVMAFVKKHFRIGGN